MGIYYGFPCLNVLKVFIRISSHQFMFIQINIWSIFINLHSILDEFKVHSLCNLFVSKSLISLIAVSLRADSGACADLQGRGLQDMRLRGQQHQVTSLTALLVKYKSSDS